MPKKHGQKPVTRLAAKMLAVLKKQEQIVVALHLPIPPEHRWFHLTPGAAEVLKLGWRISHKENLYRAFLTLEKCGLVVSMKKVGVAGKLYRVVRPS